MPLPDTNSRASPDERSTSPSRNNNMDFQDLEHEDSDGVDTQGDWIDVVSKHSKKKNKRMYEGNDKVKPTPLSVDTKTTAVKPVSLPRPPALPMDDYKMVIRPKDGLDLKKYHVSTLSDSILAAAKLMWKQAELRIRVDEEQNIITISTSHEEAARALSTVTQIDIQGKKYGINLYGLSPHDSCKGVIHEIPAHHTSKDILESLWLPGYEFIACSHLTASKDCKQRYKEPYVLRKKKWEKENNQQQYEDTTRRPRSRGRHDDDHYRPRSRSQSFPRLRGGTSRSHSRPRVSVDRRDCDSGRARSGPGASADRDVRAENYAECTVNQATKKAGASRLLIAGDFNAAHPAWGYPYYNKRGKELMECIDNETLTLLIDPAKPTRVGNSVSRDTCPDLTLAKNAPHTSWMNLEENFSSDHMLVQTEIQGTTYRRQLGEARITDWQTLRKNRETAPDDPIMNIELWVKELNRDVQRHTRTLQTTTQIPAIDNYLLHLWEARRSLTMRWRKQKLNRKLKLRITKLAAEADVYAAVLCRQNWLGQCDDLRGTLSLTKTWNLLRYLIDPMQSRGETNKTLKRILHQYPGTTEDLFKVLQAKYIASTQPLQPTPYTGPHNSPLDQPFIEAEFRAALTKIRKNTSPGMDQITNSALANLDDKSVTVIY
ncbi:uncharacterized protein ISCGN_020115 [Ixodes scapularis]